MKKAVTEVLKPSKAKKIDVRVDLKGEMAKRFRYVKDRLGLKDDEGVLIYLINDSYQRLNPKTSLRKKEEKR